MHPRKNDSSAIVTGTHRDFKGRRSWICNSAGNQQWGQSWTLPGRIRGNSIGRKFFGEYKGDLLF